MTQTNIYNDIAERTGGDIYIGVVGPVRTGKSTFIKRFMDTLVLPNITDSYSRDRARDELPQSAAGKTVMTTEPKFIPNEAVELHLGDNAAFRVKMIDCVGYIVPGALGHIEDDKPRMVMTPWSDEPMPFETAAEIGTKKVINEHSTIGVLVTTDGSIGELPRESYVEAEARAVSELKAQNKPFVIVLNSAVPSDEKSVSLAVELENKYEVPVALVSCLDLDEQDIRKILELVLLEFPIKELRFALPRWVTCLEDTHPLKKNLLADVSARAENICKVGEVRETFENLTEDDYHTSIELAHINLANGQAMLAVHIPEDAFYRVLGDKTGFEIEGEESLISILSDLADMKRKYEKFESAIRQVNETGYGIVTPSVEDLTLEEPEIVKQPGGYGVRLRASAPSIHMIKANIQTEVSPIVGSEKQSEDMVKFLLKGFEENPASIWESNMFGKSLHELVNEGLNAKLAHMPYDARMKLTDTLQKIINDGAGGLICILL